MNAPVLLESYPLSSLQGAMLVVDLSAPHRGLNTVQLIARLHEPVNMERLAHAWRELSHRHAVLRTAFRWEGLDEPRQDVYDGVEPEITELDWTGPGPSADDRLTEFLAADRTRAFDLRVPPLHRVTVMRVAPAEWIMVWSFHHILMDGRAFVFTVNELFTLYDAAGRGESVTAPTRRPYRDFAEWYAARDFGASESFWREYLRGFRAPTPLPVASKDWKAPDARPRGLQRRYLNAETTTALNAFAKEHGVTMNIIVQGAWALALARHSGEDDVVFGSTRACRKGTIEGADDVIGLFINTVPVRARVRENQLVTEWLRELRESWRAMFEYEHTPVRLIQKWSEITGTTPMFDTQFVYEGMTLEKSLQSFGGAMATRDFDLLGSTNFSMTGIIWGGKEMLLELDHSRATVDDETALRVLDHLAAILTSIVTSADKTVGELSMLPARERASIAEWNSETDAKYPLDATIHGLIEEQVRQRPDAIAVEMTTADGRRELSYRELNRRANRVAWSLKALGVKPDERVALCIDRTLETVVAILGTLKAGAAYVPVDPAYPDDRIEYMIGDAGAKVVLTGPAQRARLSGLAVNAELLDVVDAVREGERDTAPKVAVSPRNMAYVIYTSGSTGRPKGVMVEHRNVTRLLINDRSKFDFNEKDVWSVFHSFSFDFSVWELYGALMFGGRAVIVPRSVAQSPAEFVALVDAKGVTVLNQVPSAFYVFMQETLGRKRAPTFVLRYVIFGGEALKPALLKDFHERWPEVKLINMFGITETTVHVTYKEIGDAEIAAGVSNIGRSIPTLTTWLCDEQLRPVPIGVKGEICVGGLGVARGYLNRDELTAERFVRDPFSADPDARLYRSGDLGRLLPNGEIEYLGRRDHQVKIRGHRIETGEIEASLIQHRDVGEAVVVVAGEGGEARLVAYLVASGDKQPGIAELREHVMESLPEYMVPAMFMWLSNIPLTANGKVDRRALPAPDLSRDARSSHKYRAPSTPAEQALAEIWAAVLGAERVGVEDNFFELGGDSLLSVQIVGRAQAAGWRFTLGQFMRNPTVSSLATVAKPVRAVEEEQADVQGDIPLTPIQQWFVEGQGLERHWNQSFMFTVPADCDVSKLAAAANAVVQRHDSLRLRFENTAKGVRQWCAREVAPLTIEVVDLSRISEKAPEVQRSLDLKNGPLLRMVLFKGSEAESARLLIVVHHLVVDGVSWRLLVEDLEEGYSQLQRGEPIALGARTTTFGWWASRLAAPGVTEAFADELSYWEQVASAQSARVPRDFPPDDRGSRAETTDTVVVQLDEAETRALLQSVPKVYNLQINDALIAALADTFTNWVGGSEIVVNLEGHGREDVVSGSNLARTMGWFTTIFPIRLALGHAATGVQLKRVKEVLRAVPRRGIGYGVLRYLARAETLRAQTVPDVVFNYLGQFDQVVAGSRVFSFAPEPTGSWYADSARRPHLLEVNAMVRHGRLEVQWSFSSAVHKRESIAQVAAAYSDALRNVIAHCVAPESGGYTPSDFPLAKLEQDSLDSLVGESRDIEDIYPLVPMQRLFLGFADAGNDPGFEQWRYRLKGELDTRALHGAWELMVSRHAILRTAFVSQGLPEPLQVVNRNVTLPWIEQDLRGHSPDEQARLIADVLERDRATGFAFDRAPLMRITLLRLADDEYELVWSNHHLLLDRWSWPLILLEMALVYPNLARTGAPPELPRAPRYGDFVAWQQAQSVETARQFWSGLFAGFQAPPRLVMAHPDEDATHTPEVSVKLSADESRAVHTFARSQKIAPNTVVQAAWALCLARYFSADDVSLGVTVAGRDGGVEGIDKLVGLAINNLPLRVRVKGEAPLRGWLDELQHAQTEMQQFAHSPLEQVQEWSGVPWRSRLFETLMVFQHDTAEAITKSWLGDDVETRLQHVPTHTAYPLTMIVAGVGVIELRVTYDPRYFDGASASKFAEGLRAALVAMVATPEATVGEIVRALPEHVAPAAVRSSDVPYVAPRSATESVLAGIWREVLGADQVGVTDNFFALGGYSLVATQIAARIRNTLQVQAPVRLLFAHPTVGGLAAALTEMERKPGQLERVAQVVQRVQTMSLDELRQARAARAST